MKPAPAQKVYDKLRGARDDNGVAWIAFSIREPLPSPESMYRQAMDRAEFELMTSRDTGELVAAFPDEEF